MAGSSDSSYTWLSMIKVKSLISCLNRSLVRVLSWEERMKPNQKLRYILEIANVLSLLACIAILFSLSYDVLISGDYTSRKSYPGIQFLACLVLLFDFFLRLYASEQKGRFWLRHWPMLLVSIPYLNILGWTGVDLTKGLYLLLKTIPLLRGFWAIWIIVDWIASHKIRGLLWSYLLTVVGFTYFCALIFYAYEMGSNPKLDGFGDSLWWAWMNVTTVGAEIFAVTGVGKILSVALPSLGMMMFPVFTVYITARLKEDNASARRGKTTEEERSPRKPKK